MPNNDDQLQQQYQEILNKYASSLAPPDENTEIISPIVNPVATEVNLEPEIVPVTSEPIPMAEVQKIILPKVIAEPVVSKPIIKEEPITSPIYFPPEPIINKPSNFFKYLFYFSLITFIAVVSAVVYNLSNNQQTSIPIVDDVTPTSVATQFCELNDKKYAVGESFPADSMCNTCSCSPNLTIACTQNACISPTPTIKLVGKVYKDIKYGYQFECPIIAKYVVEATSVNGNKMPYKQESCTNGESVTIISVYDNTVIHSFGNLQIQISPDKKYVVTLEGDDTDIISSFKFL